MSWISNIDKYRISDLYVKMADGLHKAVDAYVMKTDGLHKWARDALMALLKRGLNLGTQKTDGVEWNTAVRVDIIRGSAADGILITDTESEVPAYGKLVDEGGAKVLKITTTGDLYINNFLTISNFTQLTDYSWLAQLHADQMKQGSSMFRNCGSWGNFIPYLAGWQTGNVTTFSSMFEGCTGLTGTAALYNWDVSKATNMSRMFYGCTGIADTAGIAQWDPAVCQNFTYMFAESGIEHAVIPWDFAAGSSLQGLFMGCHSLKTLKFTGDTSGVSNLIYLCRNCDALESLDFTDCDLSGVTNATWAISNCTALQDVYTPAVMPASEGIQLPGDFTDGVTTSNMIRDFPPNTYIWRVTE